MLSTLTEPKYPRAALGIESSRVTAVELERSGRGYAVRQAATIELPSGLIEPSFIEPNISDPGQLRVMLEEAASTSGLLSQRSWSVSLPSDTARTAILTLEAGGDGKESEDILDWKAEQTFGVSAGELRISRYKIPKDAEGRPRYLATAVKLSVIDEYEKVFEGLGWRAGLILPRAVSETRWLQNDGAGADSLLISVQDEGFTALLLKNGEPNVVRSVTCTVAEQDDEIYRLLMFYNDRVGAGAADQLNRFLVVGRSVSPAKVQEISAEALGRQLTVLDADDVGLSIPAGGGLSFDDLAAPAGLATLAWK
jgi:Tfp pilus assembly PilM family ATPase